MLWKVMEKVIEMSWNLVSKILWELCKKEIEKETFNSTSETLQCSQFSFLYFDGQKSYTKHIVMGKKLAGEKHAAR